MTYWEIDYKKQNLLKITIQDMKNKYGILDTNKLIQIISEKTGKPNEQIILDAYSLKNELEQLHKIGFESENDLFYQVLSYYSYNEIDTLLSQLKKYKRKEIGTNLNILTKEGNNILIKYINSKNGINNLMKIEKINLILFLLNDVYQERNKNIDEVTISLSFQKDKTLNNIIRKELNIEKLELDINYGLHIFFLTIGFLLVYIFW